MKYAQKSFSVQLGSDAYRDNFGRIFRSKCAVCGSKLAPGDGFANAHAVVCTLTCAGRYNAAHSVNYAFGPNR